MIRGERVWLRATERGDLDLYRATRNDENTGGIAGYSWPVSAADVDKEFDELLHGDHGKGGYYFTICLLDSDDVVGFAWLRNVELRDGNAEFSICLSASEHLGKGYGTDALNAALDFGFGELPLERIYLMVDVSNERAIRSYEKAGLTREGVLRSARRVHGRRVDDCIMAILREEWAASTRTRGWEY